MGKKDASVTFNSIDMVKYLYEKRKPLIIVTLAAAILSGFASFFVKPLYKSTAEIFPSFNQSITRALFLDYSNPAYNLLGYGKEEFAEGFMPIMESSKLKLRIISLFDLYAHYEIDAADSMAQTMVLLKYNQNVNIKKTKYMSILIEVTDNDPVFAAKLANAISQYSDSVVRDMFRPTSEKALQIMKDRYLEQKRYLLSLVDSLRIVSSKGVNDYTSQAERFNQAYASALLSGDKEKIGILENKLNKLSSYGGEYIRLNDELRAEASHFAFLNRKYHEAKVEFTEFVPYKFVVSEAIPNLKKVSPNRKLMVLGSGVAAFFFTLVLLIVSDNVKRVAQKLG